MENTKTGKIGSSNGINNSSSGSSQYAYDMRLAMTLSHLPDTILTISEMSGPQITKKQYFINTTYRLPENMRGKDGDIGIRKTKGFSIAEDDIDWMIKLLQELKESPRQHYEVCYACTQKEGKIALHRKNSADSRPNCPLNMAAKHGDAPKDPPRVDAFVVV